ncbi:MAG TPA: YceI family protein [Chitinophagaceae bacterium]|jgi:polyisoprenoid-binding protein YceI|nr:YceI family protein [Chitinophagaceae bacterium]
MANKKWTLDKAHSEIQFKVKHLMITTVTGTFTQYEGVVETQGDDFSNAKVSFTADTASVSTGNTDRDGHLKSADFFNVEQYPSLKFESTRIEKKDDNTYKLYGDMTIKNITKNIQLDVEFSGLVKDPWGNTKAGVIVSGKINRKDFDLTWNVVTEAGGLLVGEDVKITCEVQLAEVAAEAVA